MEFRKTKLKEKLLEKTEETLKAVVPIVIIVMALCFTVAPVEPGILLAFLMGAVFLVLGMILFTFGADLSMTPMGENVGTCMTRTKKLSAMLILSFVLGFVVTVSEPDLQVLAEQVPSVPNMIIVLSVAMGVGVFLMAAVARMLFNIKLSHMLILFYLIVFALTAFVPDDFKAVAFDSGGVTTGPMTVPFIMALGIGISSVRGDERAEDDSFGLVALSSVGPILSVLILGMLYHPESGDYVAEKFPETESSVELFSLFSHGLPEYMGEVAVSLLPIILFFLGFQLVFKSMNKRSLIKTGIGMGYTYLGLVLFLTGVNVGFMPAGNYLGQVLAGSKLGWIIVPVGMLVGYFIVLAEPAVIVLTHQVEELTSGSVSAGPMRLALSVGVSISLGLAMVRVLTGISILWFLIPGYTLALALSFAVPKIFTAIAFDSGGVASGPMTATFLLSFAIGACSSVGGNIVADAFGVVAMVAMTPLITIQVLGLVYKLDYDRRMRRAYKAELAFSALADDEIVEL
ncbi:MAG: DUF1538 domain-containing protein [Candidatus Avilachnospira sp.]